MTDAEVTRRGFIELTGVGLAAISGGTGQLQVDAIQDPETFDAYGLLLGPADARPSIGGPYLEQFDTFQFLYFATDTGVKSFAKHTDANWTIMNEPIPTNQVDEVKTTRYDSQFNHTFARPNEPTAVRWNATNVTNDQPEVVLTDTASLQSKERGNYAPGSEAVPGVAFRLTGAPQSGESATAGYYTADHGFGFGRDASGTYAFIRQSGTETTVYRDDWNGTEPPNFNGFEDHIRICRFEHLYYGGGSIAMQIVGFDDHRGKLYTPHRFTPANLGTAAPPFSQPNLPIAFDTDGLTPELRATAAHYEKGERESDARFLGEHASRSGIGTDDWYHVISWRKKTDYDMLNIKPLFVNAFAESANIKIEIQQNAVLGDGGGGAAPFTGTTHVDATESPIEWVTGTDAVINTDGDRRWAGHAPAGQGSSPGGKSLAALLENLDAGDTVTLAAQAYSNSGSLFVVPAQEAFY